jgi:serine/threonine protein kinase
MEKNIEVQMNNKSDNINLTDPERQSSSEWKSQSIDKYELIEVVGKGAFALVYKARLNNTNTKAIEAEVVEDKINFSSKKQSNSIKENKKMKENNIKVEKCNKSNYYALKEILLEKEKHGFPLTALRELMLLKKIKHENVIEMKDIIVNYSNNNVYFVLEYMEHDIAGLLDRGYIFSLEQVKYILLCLLNALNYLHSRNILHRDIKSSNVLINNKGDVKLSDFGLAKHCNFKNLMTNKVVTIWYRAPELLLGEKQYDSAIDIWALG